MRALAPVALLDVAQVYEAMEAVRQPLAVQRLVP